MSDVGELKVELGSWWGTMLLISDREDCGVGVGGVGGVLDTGFTGLKPSSIIKRNNEKAFTHFTKYFQ